MKLTSEITVPAARDAVWRSLSEVVRVGAEPGADGVPAEWTGTVGLLDVDEDAGTATFALRAQQRGGTGLMVGTLHGLAEASGSGTRLALEGDVRVTGAAAGDDQILAQVAREIERRLTAQPATSEAPVGEPAPAASHAPAAEVDRREPLQRFGPPALAILLGIIAAIVLQRRGGARS